MNLFTHRRVALLPALVIAGLALGATAGQASAVILAPKAPTAWIRPTSDASSQTGLSSFQEWNIFNSTTEPNLPDNEELNFFGNASLYDAAAPGNGTIVAPSSGNLYNPVGIMKPQITVPLPAAPGAGRYARVMLQVKVNGNAINTTDITAGGFQIVGLPDYSYELVSSTGSGASAQYRHAWTFSVPNVPTVPSDLIIKMGWGASSASLDQITIDTQVSTVPEPASIAALGMGAVGLLARRRRQ